MTRHRRRGPLWLGLTVIVASAAPGCARQDDHPVAVSLASLATNQEAYQGKLVRTVVRMFEPPRHFWIVLDFVGRRPLIPAVGAR